MRYRLTSRRRVLQLIGNGEIKQTDEAILSAVEQAALGDFDASKAS